MSCSVPPSLQAHLDQAATTTTRLLKIKSRTGVVFGLCQLDRDVTYDDGSGDGDITYVATKGFDPSVLSTDIGLGVGNAEVQALLSNAIPGITEEMIHAGELDDAEWVCYLVNFMDVSMGHVVLDAGDVGEIVTRFGLLWIPELLSYVARLKQPIGSVDSITCRAIFGAPTSGDLTIAQLQVGCGVDIAGLWVYGEVVSVGLETNRNFVGDEVSASGPPVPFPGRVQFLTGNNAGREYATESVDQETVFLSETTAYPIEVGDTYRIRPDCRKRFKEDCIDTWNNGPNFKGEPHIPVGDDQAIQTPNAQKNDHGTFVLAD